MLRDGGIDIGRKGKLLISGWNDDNDREDCCGYEFTINFPADATGSTTSTFHERTADEVQSSLREKGRKIGVICTGTYDIVYVSGTIAPGCGNTNCSCYNGYVVTTLGPLPGFPDVPLASRRGVTNRELEDFKKHPVRYRSDKKQDFHVGYWPYHYNSYASGSITWKIVPISGMIMAWKP